MLRSLPLMSPMHHSSLGIFARSVCEVELALKDGRVDAEKLKTRLAAISTKNGARSVRSPSAHLERIRTPHYSAFTPRLTLAKSFAGVYFAQNDLLVMVTTGRQRRKWATRCCKRKSSRRTSTRYEWRWKRKFSFVCSINFEIDTFYVSTDHISFGCNVNQHM